MNVARGVAWATQVLGGGWTLAATHPLAGGITGNVTALELRDPGGVTRRLVLKLYRPDPSEPDSAWREAHILKLLSMTDLPAPRVVAVDRDGGDAGWPALLMTRISGRRRMRPPNSGPWLRELEGLAHRIHSLPIPRDALPLYKPWGVDGPLPVPPWWKDAAAWRLAVEVCRGPAPVEPPVFIHRDFHPGNVLWSERQPPAAVDWLHGCLGPASVDLAHCRLNLWLYAGPALAARWPLTHPYWEIVDAIGWSVDPARDGPVLAGRFKDFILSALARLPQPRS